jgi:hypothetical protein
MSVSFVNRRLSCFGIGNFRGTTATKSSFFCRSNTGKIMGNRKVASARLRKNKRWGHSYESEK